MTVALLRDAPVILSFKRAAHPSPDSCHTSCSPAAAGCAPAPPHNSQKGVRFAHLDSLPPLCGDAPQGAAALLLQRRAARARWTPAKGGGGLCPLGPPFRARIRAASHIPTVPPTAQPSSITQRPSRQSPRRAPRIPRAYAPPLRAHRTFGLTPSLGSRSALRGIPQSSPRPRPSAVALLSLPRRLRRLRGSAQPFRPCGRHSVLPAPHAAGPRPYAPAANRPLRCGIPAPEPRRIGTCPNSPIGSPQRDPPPRPACGRAPAPRRPRRGSCGVPPLFRPALNRPPLCVTPRNTITYPQPP